MAYRVNSERPIDGGATQALSLLASTAQYRTPLLSPHRATPHCCLSCTAAVGQLSVSVVTLVACLQATHHEQCALAKTRTAQMAACVLWMGNRREPAQQLARSAQLQALLLEADGAVSRKSFRMPAHPHPRHLSNNYLSVKPSPPCAVQSPAQHVPKVQSLNLLQSLRTCPVACTATRKLVRATSVAQ